MAFFNLAEVLDIIIIAIALGFIFMIFIKRPQVVKNWMDRYKKKKFEWKDLLYAAMIVAPAVILHEFGHKFVAMGFGLQATFEAAYIWLGLGIILRLVNFGFIFFVPAYVSIQGVATPGQYALTAFAGPAVNAILWVVSLLIVKKVKDMKPNTRYAWLLSARINMFLFIFNMLPIPGFDGWHVYSNLIKAF
ncbi:MAG: M50 family metallopeptidase [archaeon]